MKNINKDLIKKALKPLFKKNIVFNEVIPNRLKIGDYDYCFYPDGNGKELYLYHFDNNILYATTIINAINKIIKDKNLTKDKVSNIVIEELGLNEHCLSDIITLDKDRRAGAMYFCNMDFKTDNMTGLISLLFNDEGLLHNFLLEFVFEINDGDVE